MTLTQITVLVGVFLVGFGAGSWLTLYALLDMVMRIDDARAEGRDRCP